MPTQSPWRTVTEKSRARCTTLLPGGTIGFVPTDRRRYQITETDEVARAIDAASALWPSESRARLAVRAIIAGGATFDAERQVTERRDAVMRMLGSVEPGYPDGYLADLRSDWPE